MESHSLWSENWLAGSRFQRKVPRGGVGPLEFPPAFFRLNRCGTSVHGPSHYSSPASRLRRGQVAVEPQPLSLSYWHWKKRLENMCHYSKQHDMIDPMISHEYDQQLMVHDRWKFSGKMYGKPKKKDHPQVITILMGGWLLGFPHYSK